MLPAGPGGRRLRLQVRWSLLEVALLSLGEGLPGLGSTLLLGRVSRRLVGLRGVSGLRRRRASARRPGLGLSLHLGRRPGLRMKRRLGPGLGRRVKLD